MSARRCQLHNVNAPADVFKCPICEAIGESESSMTYFSGIEPDENWREQFESALNAIQFEEEERSLAPEIPVKVTVRDGRMWVPAWDVWSAYERRLEELDLFSVKGDVYEVVHYVHDRREYLVRPFSMTLSEADLATMTAAQ